MKGNILIIDDEEKLRSLLARIISLEGQVFEAAYGKAGLRLLEKAQIQFVISDVKLADINGIELQHNSKNLSLNRQLPFTIKFNNLEE